MKYYKSLPKLPTVEQLVRYYLSRNGIPLNQRAWLDNPFGDDKVHWRLFDRYEATKHVAYQEAVDSYQRRVGCPMIPVEVYTDFYPPLFDTYAPNSVYFHGYINGGWEWKSRRYINPTYGDC